MHYSETSLEIVWSRK